MKTAHPLTSGGKAGKPPIFLIKQTIMCIMYTERFFLNFFLLGINYPCSVFKMILSRSDSITGCVNISEIHEKNKKVRRNLADDMVQMCLNSSL